MRKAALLCTLLGLGFTGCSTLTKISSGGMKAYELSLAVADDRTAVAWHGGIAGADAIFLQALDGSGRAVGAPHQITDGVRYAYEPDLQFVAGDPLLGWYEKNTTNGELTAWLARVDANGQIKWKRQLDATHSAARNTVVRVTGDEIWTAWIETPATGTPAVWVARFASDGASRGAPRRVGDAGKTTWNLNAAVDDTGTFYVTYDAQLTAKASELRLIAVTPQDSKAITLSADDAFESVYPDLAISANGEAALTWFDSRDGNEEIYFAALPLADLLAGKQPSGQRLTHTKASSIGSYLAWNGDRVAVVWCDAEPGQKELYTQSFDATGEPLDQVRQLTATTAESSIPSIRPWKDGFLVAWNEYQSAEGGGVHQAILSSEARVMAIP